MSCFLSLTDLKKRHFCVWGVLKIASQSHGAKKKQNQVSNTIHLVIHGALAYI